MATLTNRRLDEAVGAGLRQRATAAGRSMEQEVRDIPTRAAQPDVRQMIQLLREHRARFGERVPSDRGDLVRATRDEGSGLR